MDAPDGFHDAPAASSQLIEEKRQRSSTAVCPAGEFCPPLEVAQCRRRQRKEGFILAWLR